MLRRNYLIPSKSRNVKNGINVQSKHSVLEENWGARRWLEVLKSFHIRIQLGRSRSYTRKKRVSINIEHGLIKARIQGSYANLYQLRIKAKMLALAEWQRLAEAFFKDTILFENLLANEMPVNIEDVFKDAGLSLFPDNRTDLQIDCSCLDRANPCKHMTAVYYLVGKEFSKDPFLIFKMRGMERNEFINLIKAKQTDSLNQRNIESTQATATQRIEEKDENEYDEEKDTIDHDSKQGYLNEIEILKKRLAKVRIALAQAESTIKGLRQRKATDAGISSVYKDVQGLDDENPAYQEKRVILENIFKYNLKLQKQELAVKYDVMDAFRSEAVHSMQVDEGRKPRFLIADDDVDYQEILMLALSSYGECVTVMDGKEAVEAFIKGIQTGKPYSLICLDVRMPVKDGVEALKEIRSYETEKLGVTGLDGVKVIMITSIDAPDIVLSSFRSGCESYLIKHAKKKKIVAKVKDLLSCVPQGQS